jgi:hypothetical protein
MIGFISSGSQLAGKLLVLIIQGKEHPSLVQDGEMVSEFECCIQELKIKWDLTDQMLNKPDNRPSSMHWQ